MFGYRFCRAFTSAAWFVMGASCAIIVILNAIVLYFLITPDGMQQQFCRALSNVPRIGKMAVQILGVGSRLVHPLRAILQDFSGYDG